MKSRIFVFSLAAVTLLPMTTLTSVMTFAQQPSQPQPAQQEPAQQQPAPQQTPAQPLPPTQPSPSQQPAPQQTPVQPAQPAPAEPQTTGPTTTIEGAVTHFVSVGCGPSATAAKKGESVKSARSIGTPGAAATVSAAEPPTSGQGCSAVLQITPGVNWAQVARSELADQREKTGGLPVFGAPVSVVVVPQATLTTRGGSDISLQDLAKGSVVKIDYAVRNDVPVATNIDVTWHAGQ